MARTTIVGVSFVSLVAPLILAGATYSSPANAGQAPLECKDAFSREEYRRHTARLAAEQLIARQEAENARITQRHPVVPQPSSAKLKREVIAGSTEQTHNDPTLNTHEDLTRNETEGPTARTFTELFKWKKFTQRPNAQRIARVQILEGTPLDADLVNSVKVESKTRISSVSDEASSPGNQSLEIQIKLKGKDLAQLMTLVEQDHLSRYGMTVEELTNYGRKYEQSDYSAYRGWPRGMAEQTMHDEFLRANPLRSRAIHISVSESGESGRDMTIYKSRSQFPIGTSFSGGYRQTEAFVFSPDQERDYVATLSFEPDVLPIVWRGNSGYYPTNNNSTNRLRLMAFYLNRVFPFIRSIRN